MSTGDKEPSLSFTMWSLANTELSFLSLRWNVLPPTSCQRFKQTQTLGCMTFDVPYLVIKETLPLSTLWGDCFFILKKKKNFLKTTIIIMSVVFTIFYLVNDHWRIDLAPITTIYTNLHDFLAIWKVIIKFSNWSDSHSMLLLLRWVAWTNEWLGPLHF